VLVFFLGVCGSFFLLFFVVGGVFFFFWGGGWGFFWVVLWVWGFLSFLGVGGFGVGWGERIPQQGYANKPTFSPGWFSLLLFNSLFPISPDITLSSSQTPLVDA